MHQKGINNVQSKKIIVKGLVQGVGFRPFIYRLANQYTIYGTVENTNEYVCIYAEGDINHLQHFINAISLKAPLAASIESIEISTLQCQGFNAFQIISSKDISQQITQVSPDIAVCNDCLEDMKTQTHRIQYPFINCTHCGPRFSIIKQLPYDRDKTTMDSFPMCSECLSEYTQINNRRFHAQPVACNNCGPQYNLTVDSIDFTDITTIIEKTVHLIEDGKIIALKSIGGFNLMCDASNEETVRRLRLRKNREAKPFAVMFRDIKTLKEYAEINEVEEKIITQWQRPIVLVNQKKKLAYSVNNGFTNIGAMLPYLPFHYLFFQKTILPAVVLTSGNWLDEPIVIDNEKAKQTLASLSDAMITYNRDIQNRVDDSVCFVVNNKARFIRRSRGYVPSPIKLNLNTEAILATGAELNNCFCIGKGDSAIVSQHIGDLKNIETYEFYTETIDKYKKLFRFKPDVIACDLHPNYFSTRFANQLGLKVVGVQHHHAHIVSCMAEHLLDEKVIGISMDGTGLGTDNTSWGAEFHICDLVDFERISCFEAIPLPGGDKVTEEPWRTAVSYLYHTMGADFMNLTIPFIDQLNKEKVNLLIQAIDKKINSPFVSSTGRLFDAVSALLGICYQSSFHAQAAMQLESSIDFSEKSYYSFKYNKTICFNEMIHSIIEDLKKNISIGKIAARFHNTMVRIIFEIAEDIRKKHEISKIVLSGGVFQNKYLLKNAEDILINNKFDVYTALQLPCNDAGIALGQLAVVAKRRELNLI